MNKTKHILLLMALAAMPLVIVAQEPDYVSDLDGGRTTGAVWTELGATKVLPYNLSLGLDAGFRTDNWVSDASRFDVGLGLSWKPTKHWKFGVGYTFLMKYYPVETERRAAYSVSETEYKYYNTDAGQEEDMTTFIGAPWVTQTAADGTTQTYQYQGYNYTTKDYTEYTRVTDAYWRAKHRISLDAAYTLRLWKTLRITLRERYQLSFIPSKTVNRVRTGTRVKSKYRYREPDYDALDDDEVMELVDGDLSILEKVAYDENPSSWSGDQDNPEVTTETAENRTKTKRSKTLQTLRSRLTFEIDRKGWKWTPYAYVETFNDLSNLGYSESFHLDKLRASIGVDYAISKTHKVSIGYVFNHEDDDDGNENIHAFSVGYKYKF